LDAERDNAGELPKWFFEEHKMNLMAELKSLVNRGPAAPAAPAPAAAVVETPVLAPEPEPSTAMAAPEPEPVIVTQAEAAPVVPDVDFLDDYGEDPCRAVDPAEEVRTDLPQRSRQRIKFLLNTYEAGNIERTMARITNDRDRWAAKYASVVAPALNAPETIPGNPQLYLSGE
jgi:hypothetical protein